MKKMKTSLRGFDKKVVDQQIEQLVARHEHRMRGLRTELQALKSENQQFGEQSGRLRPQSETAVPMTKERPTDEANLLYQAHKEQTERISQLMREVQKMLADQQMEYENQQQQNTQMLAKAEEKLSHIPRLITGKDRGE